MSMEYKNTNQLHHIMISYVSQDYVYGSAHEGVAVLLPAFAISW